MKAARRGRLVVISGPSGSGKSSICRAICRFPGVEFSVSATTRRPRPGERDGVEYRFRSRREFERLVAQDALLEWARVHDNLYGTLRAPLERALRRGKTFVLEIDVQGAQTLRAKGVEGIFVFIAPPSMRDLRRRLVARGTDTPAVVERRMRNARREMRHAKRYDRVVVNDDLSRAIAEVRSILGLRASRRTGRGASSRARSRRRVA
ncbi:MAG: guanylate kinase [Planctomycetes bacterium]|nr:guanylate kinase [Planctomycetota bacterium]